MALFADGPPSSTDDLVKYDSYLFSVTNTEGIDVGAKLSLAYDELGIEIEAIFGREASIYAPVLGQAPLDSAHLAVTPALKTWHTFKSLELVYRDAYFNQLNDRYKAKWAEYQNLASWGRSRFIDTGAGLVIDPIPQGIAPSVNLTPSSNPGGTVYLSSTFVNAAGEESLPTSVIQTVIPDNQTATVRPPACPGNAIGWNIYAGLSPATLVLQNQSPLSPASGFELVLPPGESGGLAGTGQSANVTRDLPRRIMRG